MKRLETDDDDDRIVFEVSKREYHLLRQVLSRYPLVPQDYHRERSKLENGANPERDNQAVLDEALADRRAENQRRLLAWFDDPGRFSPGAGALRLTLDAGEIQWLLEVLNEVRVGSWLRLGSPDQDSLANLPITNETAPFFWGMELCGYFQMILLEALDQEEDDGD